MLCVSKVSGFAKMLFVALPIPYYCRRGCFNHIQPRQIQHCYDLVQHLKWPAYQTSVHLTTLPQEAYYNVLGGAATHVEATIYTLQSTQESDNLQEEEGGGITKATLSDGLASCILHSPHRKSTTTHRYQLGSATHRPDTLTGK